MEKITELTTEPVVGKYYLVPCVWFCGGFLPVTGDAHFDPELRANDLHFHHDVRFLSDDDIEFFVHNQFVDRFESKAQALMAQTPVTSAMRWLYSPELNKEVVEIQFKRKLCRRTMPDFAGRRNHFFDKFHKKYLGRKVKCGRCPHRNMPLESLPQDKDGNVICSGHGLKINMRELKVVEREF